MGFVGPAQGGPGQGEPAQSGAAQGEPAQSGTARGGTASGAVTAVADMVARQRPDSRRLRQLIAILTEEPQDVAALVERCALPRQTVESVLAAAADDLSWRDGKAMIQPGKAAIYRQRFG